MHPLAIFITAILLEVAFYKIVSKLIARFLWNKYSIVKDIHLLSEERSEDEKFSGTAIICGGSVSGLFSARVCANHFKKIIIIEPEEWVAVGEKGLEDNHKDPNAPKRSRVAQYRGYHHFHVMMTLAMQEMFPTFEQTMKRVGARLTQGLDILYASGVPKITPTNFPHYSGGVFPLVMNISRPAFETSLRYLVLESCKNVQYFHGTVTGLLYDDTLNRISGVSVKLPSGKTIEMEGTLVVDATGSFMGGHRWLKNIPKYASCRSPSLDDVKISFNPKVSYTQFEFALPPRLEEDFRQYGFAAQDDTVRQIHASLPMVGPDNKVFFIDKREKNNLHVGCGGYDFRGEIKTVGDIEEFFGSLRTTRPLPSWMLEVIHSLQSEDVQGLFEYCKFHHAAYIKYHEIKSLPSNFVVVGDAQTQTDPLLAQGCSKACASAVVLNAQLHESVRDAVGYLPSSFARKYFLDVKDRTEHIWTSMKNADYKYSSTIPVPGEDIKTTARFMRTYSDIIYSLMTKDPDISRAFTCHTTWLEPPVYILAPWIVRRVAWAWIKQQFGYEIL